MFEHQRGQWLVRLNGLGFGAESSRSVDSLLTTGPIGSTLTHSTAADPCLLGIRQSGLFTDDHCLSEAEEFRHPQPMVERSTKADDKDCAELMAPAPTREQADLLDHALPKAPAAYDNRNGSKRPILASVLIAALVFAVAVPLLQNMRKSRPTSDRPMALPADLGPDKETIAESVRMSQKIQDRWPTNIAAKQDHPTSRYEEVPASPAVRSVSPTSSEQRVTPIASANSHLSPELEVAPNTSTAADEPIRVRTFVVYPDGKVARPSDTTSEPPQPAAAANSTAAAQAHGDSPDLQPEIQASQEIESERAAATAPSEPAPERPASAPARQELARRTPPAPNPVSVPLPTRKPVAPRVQSAAQQPSPSSAPQWQQEVFAR